jgi:DNA replication and repair protein RecF
MFLSELNLYQFRNIDQASLTFNKRLNVITGRNGQGKTNLVESIQILSTTKSFRTAKHKECIGWNKTSASIYGTIQDVIGSRRVGVVFEKDKRKLLIDDNVVKPTQFIGALTAITFSPSDIEIIKGQASIRRQFLDKHMVDYQPSYLQSLINYQKALRSKQELIQSNTNNNQLDAWDKILSDNASLIYAARKKFISDLQDASRIAHQNFSSNDGILSLSLESNCSDYESPEEIFNLFVESRSKDLATGRVSKGPHRDDFKITYDEHNSRQFASQGQSKSLALSLKLGIIGLIQKERGETPVVVLDDVDSELDAVRLEKLYTTIISLPDVQVFVTGTAPHRALSDFVNLTNFYTVENGQFSSVTY